MKPMGTVIKNTETTGIRIKNERFEKSTTDLEQGKN